MTKTVDQIIAEAKRLAVAEGNPFMREDFYFAEAVARHALRLATQPEQDPTRITALEAENERMKAALGEICKDSNPDWTEKRVYSADVLDDIHKIVVEAYYYKGGPHDAD